MTGAENALAPPAGPDTGTLRWAGAGDLAVLGHRLLPLRTLCALARWQGRLLYRLRPKQADGLRRNLAPLAQGGANAAALARSFLEERQTRRLLLILASRLTTDELRRVLRISGLDRLEQARADAAGRGAILLLSHLHSLGGFLAVILLRRLGYDIRVALPTMQDPWTATRARRLLGRVLGPEPTIPEQVGGFPCQFNIRPIVRVLQTGAIVAQTGDGWHSASFVDAPFLGRNLPFPTGMLSIARLTAVPVVPVFITGRADRLDVRIEEPFRVDRREGALDQAVREYAARLEQHIRAWPAAWEHWLIPDTLDTLAGWRERPLRERYEL